MAMEEVMVKTVSDMEETKVMVVVTGGSYRYGRKRGFKEWTTL